MVSKLSKIEIFNIYFLWSKNKKVTNYSTIPYWNNYIVRGYNEKYNR